jgi:hypothetical protein
VPAIESEFRILCANKGQLLLLLLLSQVRQEPTPQQPVNP